MEEHLCPGCKEGEYPHLRHETIERGPYMRSDRTHVKGTTYPADIPAIRTRRGAVKIPVNPEHHLSYQGRKWHKTQAPSTRMRILIGHAKTHGYQETMRMVVAEATRSADMGTRKFMTADKRRLEAWGRAHGHG